MSIFVLLTVYFGTYRERNTWRDTILYLPTLYMLSYLRMRRTDVPYKPPSLMLCGVSASKFHFTDRSLVVTVPSSRMPCDLNLFLLLPLTPLTFSISFSISASPVSSILMPADVCPLFGKSNIAKVEVCRGQNMWSVPRTMSI